MSIKNYIENLIISKNLEINTIFDIGGWMGYWTKEMSSGLLKDKEFIIFEANPYYEESLSKLEKKLFIDVLSDIKGKEVQYYDAPLSGESYYKENTNYYLSHHPKLRITNTIESIVQENNLPYPDFIKIDTQGSELDILKGGLDIIKNAKVIYTECPTIKYNIGAPNIQDYLNFFDELGFYPMNILENHFMDDILVQIDIVFMRKDIKIQLFGENKAMLL
jgi:FkbM family methyltransferase